jgi:hypothetical protein
MVAEFESAADYNESAEKVPGRILCNSGGVKKKRRPWNRSRSRGGVQNSLAARKRGPVFLSCVVVCRGQGDGVRIRAVPPFLPPVFLSCVVVCRGQGQFKIVWSRAKGSPSFCRVLSSVEGRGDRVRIRAARLFCPPFFCRVLSCVEAGRGQFKIVWSRAKGAPSFCRVLSSVEARGNSK